MAHRSALASPAIRSLPRGWPKPKETRTIPSCAGDLGGDLGQAGKALAVVGEAIGHHHDAMGPALPSPHQFRARPDPPGQFEPAVGFCHCGLYHLIEQSPGRCGEAAVSLLLNPMRDTSPQQVRTERFWWFGPKQLAVSFPQVRDWCRRKPIQLGFTSWIGGCLLLAPV